MNFVSPKSDNANKAALEQGALKKVSLYPNLGSRKSAANGSKSARATYGKANDYMITAAQLRAARGLLDWTRADLAKAANISPETVKNIEHGTFKPQENTAEAIIRAFAAHDVAFTENEGVQIKQESVRTFVGQEGYVEFLDDILNTMKNGGRTCQFNYSDSLISTFGGNRLDDYVKKMQSTPNLDARCLVPEGDTNFPVKHCVYKWLKGTYKTAIPYFLYGNKIAMLTNDPGEQMVWVSIHSESLAKAFLQQFDAYWNEAETVPANKMTNARQ